MARYQASELKQMAITVQHYKNMNKLLYSGFMLSMQQRTGMPREMIEAKISELANAPRPQRDHGFYTNPAA